MKYGGFERSNLFEELSFAAGLRSFFCAIINQMKKKLLISLFLIALFLVLLFFGLKDKEEEIELIFFDVGQGDSIYIEIGETFQVLIDGGPDAKVLEKLSNEMPFYDRDIELIVLTHPDSDHLYGLLEVLRNYNVKRILWTGFKTETADWQEWKELIGEEGSDIILAKSGQKIVLSQESFLEIIHPLEELGEDSNDTSIAGFLKIKEHSILLTGDISGKKEKELLERYNLKADLLKISHHGSKTSSTEEFLEEVSPKKAIISVGVNKWGHPSEEVLKRLENFGIEVLLTKESGDIKFTY
ncbi:MAG: hypothetical protein A2365_04340 [Candidatus Nealsonbacteria bacterium RIFOXYB1_FULL_40_15]|uniref:Metallo-beta-lactamase domain-containing protein n=2 Tax=Candidatus Nealsoniibacteriota TaxID=1817911 RepID=A0A1G2EMS8_9BACT|nr:MAG: hypothetical protein A2427_04175 [Candidatus Nealsonbacteria bacterium RIFOXYC1_FULL_40_7]OGZ27831.1 MAG: hypothetical protein A2365_04340 [Candidatus Nealsonbacteria bacterium RIFOXYB1_FULL_40_15]OGZ28917.1 MAG: hypothetical protein A2562_04030 [Candidatus Nealsonbacteria bacterium RIFOXYD1_FULL_39_11]